mmetsp:Transcript_67214/g.149968  ORF Transcript_67214/g.149968 Transcript_67214/m.149968 type:complete len:262 (+) Transcript_67214:544-1329(+)
MPNGDRGVVEPDWFCSGCRVGVRLNLEPTSAPRGGKSTPEPISLEGRGPSAMTQRRPGHARRATLIATPAVVHLQRAKPAVSYPNRESAAHAQHGVATSTKHGRWLRRRELCRREPCRLARARWRPDRRHSQLRQLCLVFVAYTYRRPARRQPYVIPSAVTVVFASLAVALPLLLKASPDRPSGQPELPARPSVLVGAEPRQSSRPRRAISGGMRGGMRIPPSLLPAGWPARPAGKHETQADLEATEREVSAHQQLLVRSA